MKDFLFFGMAWMVLFMGACQPSEATLEIEVQQLLKEGTAYQNQYCDLKHKTDSVWNIVARAMEKGLPANFATTDRSVFINSRNADHITMFKSFKMIDTSLQTLVMMTGKKDIELANQVRALQTQMDAFESKKLTFLKKARASNANAETEFRNRLNNIQKTSCAAH